jgi:predicted secreted protein
MAWVTAIAIYFVVWWIVLFAVMPFGVRTQTDDGQIEPGTPGSAPVKPHFGKAALRSTIASSILFAGFYWLVAVQGFGFADIPSIIPQEFRSNN